MLPEQLSPEELSFGKCYWRNPRYGAFIAGAIIAGAISGNCRRRYCYLGSNCRRSNCHPIWSICRWSNYRRSIYRRSNYHRSIYRRSNYRRSIYRRSNYRRSNYRRSFCRGAIITEQSQEQLSPEAEHNVGSPKKKPREATPDTIPSV